MVSRPVLLTFAFFAVVGVVPTLAGYRGEFEPWELEERAQQFDRKAIDEAAEAEPATSDSSAELENYDASASPHCCWTCICISVGKRKRRSVDSLRSRRHEVPKVFGSDAEYVLYDSYEKLKALQETPVIRADLYERPLSADVPTLTARVLHGKQAGVVVTVDDGRRFLLVKGNQMGRGQETVAILYDHMTDDWKKVGSKEVRQSTFGDFVKAGGDRYDLVKENGNQAAERMMQLP